MKKLLLAFGALAATLVFSSGAVAQYPSPAGSVTLSSASTVASTGSSVQLTCTVVNTAGAPVVGADCTFTIESEPGTDAAVGSKVVTRTTNAAGVATTNLQVGSTPGQIVVSAVSGGLRSVVIVTVSAAPPAAPVISPPSTGDGGLICGSAACS
jgi:hypothetical protein